MMLVNTKVPRSTKTLIAALRQKDDTVSRFCSRIMLKILFFSANWNDVAEMYNFEVPVFDDLDQWITS